MRKTKTISVAHVVESFERKLEDSLTSVLTLIGKVLFG